MSSILFFMNIISTQSEYAINFFTKFQNIISYPKTIVPTLTETEIQIILIESVLAYLEGNLSLELLVSLVRTLQESIDMEKKINKKLSSILAEINSLSKYMKNQADAIDNIHDVLIGTLDKLIKNNI